MSRSHSEAERWFRQAEEDLLAARDLVAAGRHNWACFLSQQAAEKGVKAVYMGRGESAERVHSVTVLIQGSRVHGVAGVSELSAHLAAARKLDRMYIPTRYPNGVPTGTPADFFSRLDAEESIQWAQEILNDVRRILGPGSAP